jgi:tetratricopeptide (TPR) repeat protein
MLYSGGSTMRGPWLAWMFAFRLMAADCPPAGVAPDQAQARFAEIQARAGTLFERREFPGAAEQLRAAVCLVPSNANAHHALGLAEAAAGHSDRALEALDKASRLAPEDFAIWLARAQVEASLGKYEAMRRSLLEAASREPRDARAAGMHSQLGRHLLQQKQNELALAELLRFRLSGGADPEVLFLLARLENTLGAHGDAARDGAKLEADPALSRRLRAAGAAVAGLGYKNLEQPDRAIPHLKLAIELGTADGAAILETAYLALAEIYQDKEDSAAAREALDRGRQVLPNSTRLMLALGRNLAEAADPAAAPLLRELIEKSGDADAYKWLAQAYTAWGEFGRAVDALDQLARRRPDYPMVDVMLAQAILKQDQPDFNRALDHLARAEKTVPSDPDVYYLRGKIHLTLGRYQEAVEALRCAIALAPTTDASYYQLGIAYQKLGQSALAREQFDRMTYLRSIRATAGVEQAPGRR